ncbi:glycine zipper 2TM domain-containing protein [Kordiimonas marina]|uniref:glycine zipper 2TM domain-containing protein n=1 Tax=Kordiimonas marina TaxID=2872312 RepID=UPI001FF25380|nr:glycine zipper 2TM domain-containing protein [Kordiimonas marina]
MTPEPTRHVQSEQRKKTQPPAHPQPAHPQPASQPRKKAPPASDRRVTKPRSAPEHTTGMPVRRDVGGNSTTIHRATEGDVRTPHARSVTPPAPAVRAPHAGERVTQTQPQGTSRLTTSHSSVVNRGQSDIERLRAQEDLARMGEDRPRGGYNDDQDRPRRDTRTTSRDRDDRRHVQDRDRRDRRDPRDRRTYRDRDDHHRLWYHDRHRRIYRSYYWPHYYNNIWWDSYYRSYIYYRPYYFGDWPYYSGYWPSYSRWVWYAPHHHYHYGSWCPGLSYEYTVRYTSDPYAYSPPDANNIVGTILGGVVGGIIGGEIDGSRHHRAGTVIGALVGAAIGNAITQPQTSRGYDSSTTYRRDDYNSNDPGAYTYGQENYVPPEQKRSCLEYKMQNGAYTCTKWGTDYVYDGEDLPEDTPQQ